MRPLLNTIIVVFLAHEDNMITHAAGTKGWQNTHIKLNSRVTGLQTWVDQKVLNVRQCVRLCWLFAACSDEQRCELHHMDGDRSEYSTVAKTGSLAVDMRDARAENSRGCGSRPCRQTEMCAPIMNTAVYACILGVSFLCSDDPPHIPHSQAHSDGVSSVVYTCADGYFLSGNSHISVCNRDTGTWSHVDFSCRFVDCGLPPSLHGAVSSSRATTLNSKATYSCLQGSAPTVDEIATICEGSTGQWSPLQGSCSVVTCGQPSAEDALDVELVVRNVTDPHPDLDASELQVAYGAEAKYTCKPGYTSPEGASYISECQADGTWSPRDAFLCFLVDCGQPPSVENAENFRYTATTFGENATAMCLPGFSAQGSLTLTCDETGTWAGDGHTCELNDCGDPPELFGAVAFSGNTTLNASTQRVAGYTVPVGAAASTSSLCQTSGSWNPPPSLQCAPLDCGPPPRVDNSERVDFAATTLGENVTFRCLPGFSPLHSFQLTCDETGSWTGGNSTVTCEKILCGDPP
ncbi:hypothetical protein EGW08_006417, partial [Elysia chlorotica]